MSYLPANKFPRPEGPQRIYIDPPEVIRRRKKRIYFLGGVFITLLFIGTAFIIGFLAGAGFNPQISPTRIGREIIITATPRQWDPSTVGVCSAQVKVASAQIYFLPLTRAVPSSVLPLGTALTVIGKQPDNWYENITWVQIYQSLPNSGDANFYWLQRSDVEFQENDLDCLGLPIGLLR